MKLKEQDLQGFFKNCYYFIMEKHSDISQVLYYYLEFLRKQDETVQRLYFLKHCQDKEVFFMPEDEI